MPVISWPLRQTRGYLSIYILLCLSPWTGVSSVVLRGPPTGYRVRAASRSTAGHASHPTVTRGEFEHYESAGRARSWLRCLRLASGIGSDLFGVPLCPAEEVGQGPEGA